jgi:hypothetical protein
MAEGTINIPFKTKTVSMTLGTNPYNQVFAGNEVNKIISIDFVYTEGYYYSITSDKRLLGLIISDKYIVVAQSFIGTTPSTDRNITINVTYI